MSELTAAVEALCRLVLGDERFREATRKEKVLIERLQDEGD